MMEFTTLLTVFGQADHGAGEAPQGIAALGIDPLAILAQALTFLVLFMIIKKFALQKIVDSLEKRRQTIEDGVRLGLEMEAEKQKLDEKVEKALHKARGEADAIIAQAHDEAGAIVQEAHDKAVTKVDTMLQDAHAKIDGEITKARNELQQEMQSLVAEATEIIIEEKLDANKDAKLIERALKGSR